MQKVIRSLQEEFREVEVLDAEETVSDCPTHGYDLTFFHLDLLVEIYIRALQTPSALLLWYIQAESRDYEQNEAVFRAITKSMLDNQVASRRH